jgi:hypothetical protein
VGEHSPALLLSGMVTPVAAGVRPYVPTAGHTLYMVFSVLYIHNYVHIKKKITWALFFHGAHG